MVAHDEIGGLLPIKRTIRVLDVNNQPFREQEVRADRRNAFQLRRTSKILNFTFKLLIVLHPKMCNYYKQG